MFHTSMPRQALAASCIAAICAPQAAADPTSPSAAEAVMSALEVVLSCTGVTAERARLACFDAAAGEALGAITDRSEGEAAPEGAASGGWSVIRQTDPMNDSPIVVLALTADAGLNSYGTPPVFKARCMAGEVDAYIDWGIYLGNDAFTRGERWKAVKTRIGDAEPDVHRWGISADDRASFATGRARDLLEDLLAADRFVVRISPYRENPIVAEFETEGLEAVLPEIADPCGWTYRDPG